MTWVIAILLGLILVALISANKAAAEGVWKVTKIALIGLFLCVAALAYVLCVLWYYESHATAGWFENTLIAIGVIGCPVWLWHIRREIVSTFRDATERKLALENICIFLVGFAGAYAIKLLLEHYDISGWWLIGAILTIAGSVLSWRTFTGAKKWEEVWLGTCPDAPDSWGAAKFCPVRFIFWVAVVCGCIGLIPLLFDFAMGLDFVRGRSWLAGLVVCGVVVGIFGLLEGVDEQWKEWKRDRNERKADVEGAENR